MPNFCAVSSVIRARVAHATLAVGAVGVAAVHHHRLAVQPARRQMLLAEDDGVRGGVAGGEGSDGDAGRVGDEHRHIGRARLRLDAAGGRPGAKATRGGHAAIPIHQSQTLGEIAGHILCKFGHARRLLLGEVT